MSAARESDGFGLPAAIRVTHIVHTIVWKSKLKLIAAFPSGGKL
jgi:hypothetical protein